MRMSDAAKTPGPKKAPLLPVDAEARRLAKDLLRRARHGALATLDPATGEPLATRTALASDMDGAPVVLTSTLSAHTQALLQDPRCSILVGEPGKGDPLAHPRLTVIGRARRVEAGETRERLKWRYLARHPKAELYVDFADFSFWRLEVARASLNGGFGRAYAMTPEDVLTDMSGLEGLRDFEAGAVAHMNEDHAEAVALYARAFCKAPAGNWVLTGLDPEGLDLALGDRVERLWFEQPLTAAEEMRPLLVRLAKEAREKLGGA
ncbi:HugZ family protein [Pelagibius marinus]|uniref:HugZ family pyridoxamine 5'-phosphate oxidase n=1 Tax=Pelagibius marinus TaxID=2762760 RepID=UPI0029CA23A3|nr:HugZ family protein [Pelagibius marinus]